MTEHGIRPALALHVQKRSPAPPPSFTPRSAIIRARFTRLLAFLLARHGDCTAFCLKNLRFREPPARMGPAHHPISAYPRVPPPPPSRSWLTVGSAGSSGTHRGRPVTTHPLFVVPPSSGTRYRARSVRLRPCHTVAPRNQPDPARFPKRAEQTTRNPAPQPVSTLVTAPRCRRPVVPSSFRNGGPRPVFECVESDPATRNETNVKPTP